jgi:hypothetical protein
MKLLWRDLGNNEHHRISYWSIGVYRVRFTHILNCHYTANKVDVCTDIEVLNSSLKWRTLLVVETIYEGLEEYALVGDAGPITKNNAVDHAESRCLDKTIMLLDGA